MDIYKCDTCGKERMQEDKRVVKVLKVDDKPTQRETETCVFCLVRGLVITTNMVKVLEVPEKEKVK